MTLPRSINKSCMALSIWSIWTRKSARVDFGVLSAEPEPTEGGRVYGAGDWRQHGVLVVKEHISPHRRIGRRDPGEIGSSAEMTAPLTEPTSETIAACLSAEPRRGARVGHARPYGPRFAGSAQRNNMQVMGQRPAPRRPSSGLRARRSAARSRSTPPDDGLWLKLDEIARSEPPRRGFSLDQEARGALEHDHPLRGRLVVPEAGRARLAGRHDLFDDRARPFGEDRRLFLRQARRQTGENIARFGSSSRPKSHFRLCRSGTQIAALSSPWGSAFPSRAAMATAAQTTASSLSS